MVDNQKMPAELAPILKLEVPMIVVLGRREMTSREVVALVPGAVIELPKEADEELELMVNNKAIAAGNAVKVGENFGIRLSYVGDLKKRIAALGQEGGGGLSEGSAPDLDALADSLLQNQ